MYVIGLNISPDSVIGMNMNTFETFKVKISNPITNEDIKSLTEEIEKYKIFQFSFKHGAEKGKFKSSPNTFRIEGVIQAILKDRVVVFSPSVVSSVEKDYIEDLNNIVIENKIKKINYKSLLNGFTLQKKIGI